MTSLTRLEQDIIRTIINGLMYIEQGELTELGIDGLTLCDLFGDNSKQDFETPQAAEKYIRDHIYHFPFDTTRSTNRTKQHAQISVFADTLDNDRVAVVVESVVNEAANDYRGFSRATLIADCLMSILSRRFKVEECEGTKFDRVGFFGHQIVIEAM